MKILIISSMPTHPPFDGNRACILSYAELLVDLGYDVYFLWIANTIAPQPEEQLMKKYWGDKLFLFKKKSYQKYLDKIYRNLRFKLSGYYHIDDLFPVGLIPYIKKLKKEHTFNFAIVNYIFYSKCFNALGDVNKILYTHDVFTNRAQRTGNLWYSTTAFEEAKALNRADDIWSIQETESAFFSYLTKRNIISTFSYFRAVDTPYVDNQAILFLSGANQHNIEAINEFIDHTLPVLSKAYPQLRLIIGGSICNKLQYLKNNSQIDLYGQVEDLTDFYTLGNVFVNPTFSGTGLKIKTFEAMAYGKVMICHPHNVEGIYKKDSAPIIIASDTADYLAAFNLLFNKNEALAYRNTSIKYMKEFNQVVKQRITSSLDNLNARR